MLLLYSRSLLLQAVGLTWIALIAGPEIAYSELVLPLITAGVGVSMAIPAAQIPASARWPTMPSARRRAPTA